MPAARQGTSGRAVKDLHCVKYHKMKAYKYTIEGYEDEIHLGGHFKHQRLFFPEPYNFSITFDAYTVKCTNPQTAIDDFSGCRFFEASSKPTVHTIEVSDMRMYHEYFQADQRMKASAKDLRARLDAHLSDEDKFFDADIRARDCYYEIGVPKADRAKRAMVHWTSAAALDTPRRKEAYYNLACCCADIGDVDDVNGAVGMLQKAVDAGFTDWETCIEERSFRQLSGLMGPEPKLEATPSFVKVIQQMVDLQARNGPPRAASHGGMYMPVGPAEPSGTDGAQQYRRLTDVFLERNNITARN